MSWRVAKSLDELLSEVDAVAVHRSKISDGCIGDAEHAKRNSDHNPWVRDGAEGVVTARDFTHDPAGGFDGYAFAEALRLSHDGRIKYVISHGRIFDGSRGTSPWTWRPYTGPNAHDHHTHVSVLPDKPHYDDVAAWSALAGTPTSSGTAPATPVTLSSAPGWPGRRLARGAHGDDVREFQDRLRNRGWTIDVDGDFGPATDRVVRQFQAEKGLQVDGVVGPDTWNAAWTAPVTA